jgi:predicted dehydrogenase
MMLQKPLDIALIGTGFRSQTVYRLIFPALKERGVRLVAVCDPVREHADAYAESVGVRAFYSLRDLVKVRPMEAAIVVAPVPVHYAISCYLSENGIHNLVETSMASLLAQAQEMVETARRHRVIMRVGEQFFRLPFQRIAQKVAATGFLGPVRRIVSTFDHTGYHNNSCWIAFFRAHPTSVQGIAHTMPVAPHRAYFPHRHQEQEAFHAHFYTFPDNRFVADLTSNGKGLLGRHPRPGYTQVEGERGAIVWRAASRWNAPLHQAEGEVRYCSDQALQTNGIADQVFPILCHQENEFTKSLYVNLPVGRVEYVNPLYNAVASSAQVLDYYHAAVAEHVLDFARAVRGEGESEFTDEDALMSMMMLVAINESILRRGERIDLPLRGELESEEREREALRRTYGVDPLDVEGMLDVGIPRA